MSFGTVQNVNHLITVYNWIFKKLFDLIINVK